MVSKRKLIPAVVYAGYYITSLSSRGRKIGISGHEGPRISACIPFKSVQKDVKGMLKGCKYSNANVMHSECPLRISSYTELNLCRAMPPQLHHRHGSKDSLSTQLGDLFGHLGPAFLLTRRAQVAKGTLHSTLAAFCVYKGAGFARAKFMVY